MLQLQLWTGSERWNLPTRRGVLIVVSPTSRNQSFGYAEGTRTSVGQQFFKLRVWVGRSSASSNTDDAATADGTELSPNAGVTFFWELWGRRDTTFVGSAIIGAGVYLFPDGQDGAGAGTGKVEYVQLQADTNWMTPITATYAILASGTASFAAGGIFPGSYRVVPVLKKIDDAGGATNPTTAQVSTGANSEVYLDSDQNSAFSTGIGSDPSINSIVNTKSGWMRVGFDFQSGSSSIEPNQGYSKQPTVTWDPTALTTIRNPKTIRLGPVQDATPGGSWNEPAASVAPVKVLSQTPASGGGANTSAAYNIDTDFPAASTLHRLRWLVGPTGGQSSTPSGEQADVVSTGTLNVVDTNDKAWAVFKTVPAGFTRKDKFTVQRDTAINIGSGISVTKTSGGASGVGVFGDSGRTTAQDLFRRRQTTSTAHAIPFLRAFVLDAFGVALSSVSVKGQSITQNASPQTEDNQTLTTGTGGSAGNIDWSYTVTAAHAAFNRYAKTAASRVAGSHATTGPDSAASPPATFSIPNGGAYSGPFPAYPKTVRVVGNAYAGTKEPTVDTVSVFGVNSELVLEDIFTCDAGQDTVNANSEPTGVANRSKAKATGSLKFKDCTDIIETTGRLMNLGEFHPKDVAGRNYSVAVSADHLTGRFAVWGITSGTRTIAPTSESNDNYALQGSLGYGGGSGGDNGFQSMSDPADPGNYALYFGRADTTAQRDTFDLSSSSETAGFTGDSGNFGWIREVISFVAIDATLRASLLADKLLYIPGDTHRFNLNSGKYLPDNSESDVFPDAAPTIYIRKDTGPATAQSSLLSAAAMSAVGLNLYAQAGAAQASQTIDGTRTKLAVAFTLSKAKHIASFQAKLAVNSGLTCDVQVETDSGGSPSGSIALTGLSLAGFTFGGGASLATGLLATPNTLAAGTYWLVFTRTAGSGTFAGTTGGTPDLVKTNNGAWGLDPNIEGIAGSIDGTKTADWEYIVSPGLGNGSYKAFCTYFVLGSRPPGGGEFDITVGVAGGSIALICILRNLTNPDRHFQAGDQIQVSVHAVDSGTGSILDLDSSPAPAFFLQRIKTGVPEHLNAAGAWVSTVANMLYSYAMTLDAANKRWYLTLSTDATWTNDFAARALAYYRGVAYRGAESREVVGPANAHDKLYTISLGAGDPAKPGSHWTAGQGLTVGAAVQDRTGLVAFDAGTMKLAVGRFDPAIGSLRFLKSDLTIWEATDTPYYHTMTASPGNGKIGLFTLTGAQTAAFNLEDLFIIPKATVGGYEVQATGQMVVVDGKFKHDATNEASIPYDPVSVKLGGTGHEHLGPVSSGGDGSSAIGER